MRLRGGRHESHRREFISRADGVAGQASRAQRLASRGNRRGQFGILGALARICPMKWVVNSGTPHSCDAGSVPAPLAIAAVLLRGVRSVVAILAIP